MFTILFFVSIIFLPLTILVQYVFTNIIESKYLVPTYIIIEDVEDDNTRLDGDINFSLRLNSYGGECVQSGLCHSQIYVGKK